MGEDTATWTIMTIAIVERYFAYMSDSKMVVYFN